MVNQVSYGGSRADVVALIRAIPDLCAGLVSDPYGVVRRIKLRAGVALLSKIQQDFVRKSRGERGEDGIEWPPLKPETIANRRITRQDKRDAGVSGRRYRGWLTKEQDEAFRRKFASVYRSAVGDVGEAEAKRIAGASATKYVREFFGAKTKVELFGNRKVDILRDTGELLRSLSPGVGYTPSGAEGQIFEVDEPGLIVVGTNKKPWHHRGTDTLPARPLWPLDGSIPAPWWDAIKEAVETGIVEAIQSALVGSI